MTHTRKIRPAAFRPKWFQRFKYKRELLPIGGTVWESGKSETVYQERFVLRFRGLLDAIERWKTE